MTTRKSNPPPPGTVKPAPPPAPPAPSTGERPQRLDAFKPGVRVVRHNGIADPSKCGTVIEAGADYLLIRWDTGHRGYLGWATAAAELLIVDPPVTLEAFAREHGLTVAPLPANPAASIDVIILRASAPWETELATRWADAVRGTSLEGVRVIVLDDRNVEIVLKGGA